MTTPSFATKVTVAEAIKTGKRKIFWPIKAMVLGLGSVQFFVVLYFQQKVFEFIPLFMGISILLILACWAWWAYHIVEWRFWAVAHVQDLKKLEARARENQLIHNKLDELGRFEIASTETRERYKNWYRRYQSNSKEEEVVDKSLPAETILAYSWKSHVSAYYLGIIGLILVVGSQIDLGRNFHLAFPMGVIMLGISLVSMISFAIKKSRYPQVLKVNDRWIQFKQEPPIPWSAIHTAVASSDGGRAPQTYLTLQTQAGPKLVWKITNLNLSVEELDHILEVYRARAKKSTM
ncbi:MAG: hypothetical protein HUU01_15455 [Saprospiraceae bacterium]|nr:hypothetical protein [Saprospiraceae bacterium]